MTNIIYGSYPNLLDDALALSQQVKVVIGTNPSFWLSLPQGRHCEIRDLILAGCLDEIAEFHRCGKELPRWERTGRVVVENFGMTVSDPRLWTLNLLRRHRDRVARITAMLRNNGVDNWWREHKLKAKHSINLGQILFDELKEFQKIEHFTQAQESRLQWIRSRVSSHLCGTENWEDLSNLQRVEFERAAQMDQIQSKYVRTKRKRA